MLHADVAERVAGESFNMRRGEPVGVITEEDCIDGTVSIAYLAVDGMDVHVDGDYTPSAPVAAMTVTERAPR